MINGFNVHIASTDLSALLTERADYHQKRASQKADEIPKLQASMAALDKMPGGVASTYASTRRSDPVEEFEEQIKTHKFEAAKFALFAKHVAPNETYELTDHDLQRLQLVS